MGRTRVAAVVLAICGGLLLGSAGCTGQETEGNRASLGENVRGGWNLKTPELVSSAAGAGVTVAFLYEAPPDPYSPLGNELSTYNMRVVSGEISQLVAAYECSRTHTVAPRPANGRHTDFCAEDPRYTLDSLMKDVSAVIEQDRGNPFLAGYWVLDDAPTWDFGSLRSILSEIRTLIPDHLPAICGFSAGLASRGGYVWEPGFAENFSPDGCDLVAPYVYTDSHDSKDPPLDGVDWSMTDLLPDMLSSLARHGRDPARHELLGVGQAWGGSRTSNGAVTDPPGAAEMAAQATAFCNAGATGIAWYAWTITTRYEDIKTPANSGELYAGVRNTAGSCREAGW